MSFYQFKKGLFYYYYNMLLIALLSLSSITMGIIIWLYCESNVIINNLNVNSNNLLPALFLDYIVLNNRSVQPNLRTINTFLKSTIQLIKLHIFFLIATFRFPYNIRQSKVYRDVNSFQCFQKKLKKSTPCPETTTSRSLSHHNKGSV